MIFEDIRALSHIHDLGQLQVLAKLLKQQVGKTVKYSNLAKKVRASQPTIQVWIDVLSYFYYCFMVRPKDKKEVDFLVTENEQPWLMVEVKASKHAGLNPPLVFHGCRIATDLQGFE